MKKIFWKMAASPRGFIGCERNFATDKNRSNKTYMTYATNMTYQKLKKLIRWCFAKKSSSPIGRGCLASRQERVPAKHLAFPSPSTPAYRQAGSPKGRGGFWTRRFRRILRWCFATLPRRIVASLAIVFLIIGPISFLFWRTPKASAAWWNDSWQYRKSVAVTNNTTDESNVYVSLTLDTSDTTRFKTNCGDLRFTKINGELLPYYIVSGCGSASTVTHVNFDIFPAGAQTIYYYYGNPNAANGFSAADFSTVASNYTVGSLGTEEKGTGPVAYWSFDEGQGTTANDGTSNRNNGTLTNMSATASSTSGWQTEDACVSGKCLAFDGGNDYVDVSNITSHSFFGDAFTITAWAKLNSWSSNQDIFGTGISPLLTDQYISIDFSAVDNKYHARTRITNENNVASINTYNNDTNWHYFALAVDTDGKIINFYI
ncbi:MAG: DUF2341 domain-containing protein, partial [Candidatus Liptonbacteria bacterium]|nr:DUF2341 domain-containing protein [Candidatus Liptonbacteria bacterium]